jgi:hypothetical protein
MELSIVTIANMACAVSDRDAMASWGAMHALWGAMFSCPVPKVVRFACFV